MNKFLLAMVVAVAGILGLASQPASAAWVTRTDWRWDPCCGRYIPHVRTVWVPDPCCNHAAAHGVPGPFGGRGGYGLPYRSAYRSPQAPYPYLR
jgi:hypothetical protein